MAIAALLTPASDIAGQADQGNEAQVRIFGHVVDAGTGMPIVGARVAIIGSEWMAVTNREGHFALYKMEPGVHVVEIEQLGYSTLVARLEAAADGTPVELGIEPDPIILEGLEVVTRRFERRRRAVGISVRALDQQDLATSSYFSAADMVERRFLLQRASCENGRFECIYARGRSVSPDVYIDEVPAFDGWSALDAYSPHELYLIEVFAGGSHVRAYTHHFMERASRIRYLPIQLGRW